MNERTKKEITKFLLVSKIGKKKKKKQVKQKNFQEIPKNTDEYQSILSFTKQAKLKKSINLRQYLELTAMKAQKKMTRNWSGPSTVVSLNTLQILSLKALKKAKKDVVDGTEFTCL